MQSLVFKHKISEIGPSEGTHIVKRRPTGDKRLGYSGTKQKKALVRLVRFHQSFGLFKEVFDSVGFLAATSRRYDAQ